MREHIRMYEGFADNELCDSLIQANQEYYYQHQEGTCPRKKVLDKNDKLVRKVNAAALEVLKEYFSNYPLEMAEDCYELDHTVFACYEVGDRYKVHTDSNYEFTYGDRLRVRTISMLLYLNDDFEGGDLHFPELDLKIHPKKASFMVFPTGFLYPHQVDISTNRRNVIMFFWYKTRDHNELHFEAD
jgi:predicted 2-oxoglutarate/Fe(II)-dependent dioxygenase YbiX